jgi:DNA-binding NtrC family response regulator
MDKINILVLADHPEILATIIRLINKNELWNGTGVSSSDKARTVFDSDQFDLVLFGVGVDEEAKEALVKVFKSQKSDVICIRHYGGGSGLLYSEITHALAAGKL